MADLVHGDGDPCGVVGRHDDDVVAAVDAGVGQVGREQGFEQHEEAAAVVAGNGLVQIDVGAENGVHHGIVDAGLKGFVLGAVMDPDEVQVNVGGEGAQQWKDVDDLCRLRRKLGFIDVGGERRRRREIQRERDVLADVEAGVAEMMGGDIGAEGIAAGAGVF